MPVFYRKKTAHELIGEILHILDAEADRAHLALSAALLLMVQEYLPVW